MVLSRITRDQHTHSLSSYHESIIISVRCEESSPGVILPSYHVVQIDIRDDLFLSLLGLFILIKSKGSGIPLLKN